MGIDIKFPIGLMFAILGAVLSIYGFVTRSDPEMYRKSLDTNINLWTGIAMLAFGLFMLLASIFQKKKKKPNPRSKELAFDSPVIRFILSRGGTCFQPRACSKIVEGIIFYFHIFNRT
jgi:hypothetical protein